MTLSVGFQFSQNSLQDYADCPRRFQLRYLLRQPWPAADAEPLGEYERLLDLARRFHQSAQRHNLGLPETDLTVGMDDAELRRWWRNYLESPPPNLPAVVRRPEVTLSLPLRGHRLSARYDLLALDPGERAVVVDWKTIQKRPSSTMLANRLQTRVYRYVLVEAGTALNGGIRLSPEQVTMVYWFAAHPAQPEILAYDTAQHTADGAYLDDLVSQIIGRVESDKGEWDLTADERHCRFCTYRSLCDRGILPGPVSEFDADGAFEISLDFQFEEVEEIEY